MSDKDKMIQLLSIIESNATYFKSKIRSNEQDINTIDIIIDSFEDSLRDLKLLTIK